MMVGFTHTRKYYSLFISVSGFIIHYSLNISVGAVHLLVRCKSDMTINKTSKACLYAKFIISYLLFFIYSFKKLCFVLKQSF